MNTIHRRKARVAILTSLACLLLMAAPTSAATTVTWEIVSGSLTTHWAGVTHGFPPADATCGPAPGTDPWTLTASYDNPTTGVSHVTNNVAYGGFAPVDILLGSWGSGFTYTTVTGDTTTTTGAVNPAADTLTQTVDFKYTVRNCSNDAVACVFNVEATLHGTNYTGAGTVPVTGDTVTIAGSAFVTPQIGCHVTIRAQIVGSTIGIVMSLVAQ